MVHVNLILTSFSWSTDLNFRQVFVIRKVSLLQSELTLFGQHSDDGWYMSARHVSFDLDLIFTVYCLC
jgi:hypothetical protein